MVHQHYTSSYRSSPYSWLHSSTYFLYVFKWEQERCKGRVQSEYQPIKPLVKLPYYFFALQSLTFRSSSESLLTVRQQNPQDTHVLDQSHRQQYNFQSKRHSLNWEANLETSRKLQARYMPRLRCLVSNPAYDDLGLWTAWAKDCWRTEKTWSREWQTLCGSNACELCRSRWRCWSATILLPTSTEPNDSDIM